jgi:hypothetical protein
MFDQDYLHGWVPVIGAAFEFYAAVSPRNHGIGRGSANCCRSAYPLPVAAQRCFRSVVSHALTGRSGPIAVMSPPYRRLRSTSEADI